MGLLAFGNAKGALRPRSTRMRVGGSRCLAMKQSPTERALPAFSTLGSAGGWTLLCVTTVSSLRRGHANLLCLVPILKGYPRRDFNWARNALVKLHQTRPREAYACPHARMHAHGVWGGAMARAFLYEDFLGWLGTTLVQTTLTYINIA